MDYKSTLSSLFYLLTGADGKVNERELLLGKKLIDAEGISEVKFNEQVAHMKTKTSASVYSDCLAGLKKLEPALQIRCIAWLCVIANSDGFMDKEEWVLIYKIYHTELKLSLDEIMKTQKDLNKIIHGKSFHSIGVRV